MKLKLIGGAGMLMLLGSPIFAQTPGGGGSTDLHLPFAYQAVGLASGLCGLGQGKVAAAAAEAMARNPGAGAGIRLALLLGLAFIESLALYALFVSYIAK